jgi:hypothetical protein
MAYGNNYRGFSGRAPSRSKMGGGKWKNGYNKGSTKRFSAQDVLASQSNLKDLEKRQLTDVSICFDNATAASITRDVSGDHSQLTVSNLETAGTNHVAVIEPLRFKYTSDSDTATRLWDGKKGFVKWFNVNLMMNYIKEYKTASAGAAADTGSHYYENHPIIVNISVVKVRGKVSFTSTDPTVSLHGYPKDLSKKYWVLLEKEFLLQPDANGIKINKMISLNQKLSRAKINAAGADDSEHEHIVCIIKTPKYAATNNGKVCVKGYVEELGYETG